MLLLDLLPSNDRKTEEYHRYIHTFEMSHHNHAHKFSVKKLVNMVMVRHFQKYVYNDDTLLFLYHLMVGAQGVTMVILISLLAI